MYYLSTHTKVGRGTKANVGKGTKAEVGTKAEAGRGDIRHAADERRHEVGR